MGEILKCEKRVDKLLTNVGYGNKEVKDAMLACLVFAYLPAFYYRLLALSLAALHTCWSPCLLFIGPSLRLNSFYKKYFIPCTVRSVKSCAKLTLVQVLLCSKV